MDEQITRALYLGGCLMILVLALTSFFTAYHDYQAYASHVRHYTGSQGVAKEEAYAEKDSFMTGQDVTSLILARRRADRERFLGGLYGEPADPGPGEYPELMVDGMSYRDVRIEGIEPDSLFQSHIIFDPYGRPVRVEIEGR